MSITKKSKIYSTCLFIFFVIIAIITLLPLALLAVSSLRPGSDLMRYGLNFSIDWASANLNEYKMLFSGANSYFIWYKNSLIITIVQVGLALFLSACVGYGFAMYNFKGKNILFLCVLLVMMIPTEVILLPLYRLIVKMGLINNMWGIILPYLVVPMLVFFFRQYLMGIPKDFLLCNHPDSYIIYLFPEILYRRYDSRRSKRLISKRLIILKYGGNQNETGKNDY